MRSIGYSHCTTVEKNCVSYPLYPPGIFFITYPK